MPEVATREEIDGLIKTVKDTAEAIKKAQESDKENIKSLVEQTIKQVLASHPGVTPERKILFSDNQPTRFEDLLGSAPKGALEALDNCFLLSKVLGRPVQELKSWSQFKSRFADFKKAMDTATSGGGSEWVPTGWTSNLWELVRVQGQVAALFPVIPMPTKVYEVPIQLGRVVSKKHAEQTADTGQTLTGVGDANTLTGQITLTAVDHEATVLVSKNLEEDSIIPILPWLQKQVVMALAEGRENAIINGDTAGTQDSDDSASDANTRLWNGLRYLALNNSLAYDLATLTIDNIRNNLRAGMGKYGVMPSDLAYICDLRTYIKLLGLDEVKTLDKLGPNATILKGMLGTLDGSPLIVTEWARNSLNASGVYDGVTTNKGGLLLVNRNGYIVGERRQADVMILRELYARSRQDAIMTTERVTFSPSFPVASNSTVGFGYNIG